MGAMRQERETHVCHVPEPADGAVHAKTKDGEVDAHVESRARQTLVNRTRVGLERTLALWDRVPVQSSRSSGVSQDRKDR